MYRRPELEFKWPNLSGTDYRVTSPKSQEYNCFAYAAGETDRFYWPDGVPQEETLEAYIQAYQTLGYIEHDLDALSGDRYGMVGQIMKRPLDEERSLL